MIEVKLTKSNKQAISLLQEYLIIYTPRISYKDLKVKYRQFHSILSPTPTEANSKD